MKRRLALLVLLDTLLVAWCFRGALLARAGMLLVAEDALAPADAIVVSIACPRAGVLDAARLYRQGLGRLVVLPRSGAGTAELEIRALGIPLLAPHELGRAILEHRGVPPKAIVVPDETVDGTTAEVAATARLARERKLRSVLYLTARSHTARARWLLRRRLPPATTAIVRGVACDSFSPDAWWHARAQVRELVTEYLRWASLLVPAPEASPATSAALAR